MKKNNKKTISKLLNSQPTFNERNTLGALLSEINDRVKNMSFNIDNLREENKEMLDFVSENFPK